MLKSKSDSGLRSFISSGAVSKWVVVVAVAGALLMLLGTLGFSGESDKTGDSLEMRTAELCSAIEGVGECSVMITYGDEGEVYAVAVLCEGAESLFVERELKGLASSLFGIGTNRVSVLKISK